MCADSGSTGQFHPATTRGSPGGPAPPLTWAFALPRQKTFQDRAKSVPTPVNVEPLTSAFLIRASPTRAERVRYAVRKYPERRFYAVWGLRLMGSSGSWL